MLQPKTLLRQLLDHPLPLGLVDEHTSARHHERRTLHSELEAVDEGCVLVGLEKRLECLPDLRGQAGIKSVVDVETCVPYDSFQSIGLIYFQVPPPKAADILLVFRRGERVLSPPASPG